MRMWHVPNVQASLANYGIENTYSGNTVYHTYPPKLRAEYLAIIGESTVGREVNYLCYSKHVPKKRLCPGLIVAGPRAHCHLFLVLRKWSATRILPKWVLF
jgi:hypothetical protein